MAQVVFHPASFTYGLWEIDCQKLSKGLKGDAFLSAITLANVIGWIPIIGAIIGAIRIYAGVKGLQEKDPEAQEVSKGLIARGVAEILGSGPLLCIVDIVVTIARRCLMAAEES